MAALLGGDREFGFAIIQEKSGDAKTDIAVFCSHFHVYFVIISGPINVLGKIVEIHGT
jgi:hypothetical protein